MTVRVLRALLPWAFALLGPVAAFGQGLPPASQIPGLIQNLSPDQLAQLQAGIQGSGMTPDQIRARLTAQGLPANTLDSYLPGGKTDSNTVLNGNVFAAIKSLGLLSQAELDSLTGTATRSVQGRDTTRKDTTLTKAQAALRDSGFAIFGADIFAHSTTQFAPNLAGPPPPDYRIGPGDQFVLALTGDVQANLTPSVTSDGLMFIENVGQPLPVAGLTMRQLEDLLYVRLGQIYSGIKRGPSATTHFQITLSRAGNNQAFVYGDVRTQGTYLLSRFATMLYALYAAGGPSPTGSMRDIRLLRGGQLVGTVDFYDYLIEGSVRSDLHVESGDQIFVPPRGPMVRVAGAVNRPATYELKGPETLADVIRLAEGYRPDADLRRVQIDRIVPVAQRTDAGRDRKVVDIPLGQTESSQLVLEPGDVVHVPVVDSNVVNRITVSGNAWSPGRIALVPGMRLSDALKLAGGLKSDTYLGAVQISRLQPDYSRSLIKVALRDTLGNAVDDIPLRDGDQIRVFSISQYRQTWYVVISGAVDSAGRYPFVDGMTLRDLVMQANGLKDGALLADAEIARFPDIRTGGVLARTIHVPLDSGYLFQRSPGGGYVGPPGLQAPASSPDVLLQPYDEVLIKRQPDFADLRTVDIEGEVRYPGRYALLNKNERLSELIRRAGGLTPYAYPGGVVFTRKGGVGRIGLDLTAVIKDSTNIDNLFLVDSDVVTVPVYSGVVLVRGAVNTQVAVAYVEGENLDYYVRAAGGGSALGEVGSAYVTQPDGRVESKSHTWLHLHSTTPVPRPGSTVFVPAKDPNSKTDWAAIVAVATSTLGSLVAVAALLK